MSRLSSPNPPARTPSPARSLSPDAPPTLQGQLLSAQRTSDLYDTSEDEAELQGLSGSSAEVSPCVSPAPPKIVDFVPKKIQFVQADAQGDCNLRPEGGSSNAPAIVVSDPDATEAILGGKSDVRRVTSVEDDQFNPCRLIYSYPSPCDMYAGKGPDI